MNSHKSIWFMILLAVSLAVTTTIYTTTTTTIFKSINNAFADNTVFGSAELTAGRDAPNSEYYQNGTKIPSSLFANISRTTIDNYPKLKEVIDRADYLYKVEFEKYNNTLFNFGRSASTDLTESQVDSLLSILPTPQVDKEHQITNKNYLVTHYGFRLNIDGNFYRVAITKVEILG